MVYLIGTNHELQHSAPPWGGDATVVEKARLQFKSYLRAKTRKLNPNLVGEELSEAGLDELDAQSNLKAVAEELGIEHRFCDPDRATRPQLGIPPHGTEHLPEEERRRYDAIREDYWLDRISDRLDLVVLFVCGERHISSFGTLLRSKGYEPEVLESYWGRKIYVA